MMEQAQYTQQTQQNPQQQQPPLLVPPDQRPQPEAVIAEWEAPVRPFKKHDRQYYTTIAILVILVSAILTLAGQFMFIAVVLAFAFVNYVLSAVPPQNAVNKLTTYGVRSDQSLYYWEELGRFWFSQKYGQTLLHIEVNRFPNHLTLLLGPYTEAQMTEVLSQILLQEKPLPTTYDKASAWLQKVVPLEK